jgi:hypothetical protein
MKEPAPPAVKAFHYQILAAVGLALICLGAHWQDIAIANIFLSFVGFWMILFPRPRIPLLFLILLIFVQLLAHYEENQHRFPLATPFVLFQPTTIALAAGTMLFVGSQYRLIALKWHITPFDPRFPRVKARADLGRPVVSLARPESVIGPDEIIRMIVNTAFCVLIGQWLWQWLSRSWATEVNPPFFHMASLIWFGVVGLFIGAGVVGYWRRAHSDAATARLYLQEIDWLEARREYGRIGRWVAWGKRKMARKERE